MRIVLCAAVRQLAERSLSPPPPPRQDTAAAAWGGGGDQLHGRHPGGIRGEGGGVGGLECVLQVGRGGGGSSALPLRVQPSDRTLAGWCCTAQPSIHTNEHPPPAVPGVLHLQLLHHPGAGAGAAAVLQRRARQAAHRPAHHREAGALHHGVRAGHRQPLSAPRHPPPGLQGRWGQGARAGAGCVGGWLWWWVLVVLLRWCRWG